jgi:uncharacterized protein
MVMKQYFRKRVSMVRTAIYLFSFMFIVTGSSAASFDCRKASTLVEQEICNNPYLSKLDDVLSQNYKSMMESDFGNTKQFLRSQQRQWLAERNQCRTTQCLINLYRLRIDETCDYGVVSGIHPVCTMSQDIR